VRLIAPAIALALLLSSVPALAFDVDLDADSTAQAYQLHSPAGAPMLLRRRLTETLSLSVRDASPTGVDQPDFRFRSQLRLDADFGIDGDELQMGSNPATSRYVPLLRSTPVNLVYGYLEGRKLLHGWLNLQLGREFVIDCLGFSAIDGLRVSLTPPKLPVTLEMLAGTEARSGLPFAADVPGRFDSLGVMHTDRSALPTGGFYSYQSQGLAPLVGATLTVRYPQWLKISATARESWNTSSAIITAGPIGSPTELGFYDSSRISSARVGGEVVAYLLKGDLVARTQGAYDFYRDRLTSAIGTLDFSPNKKWNTSLEYEYFMPLFDADSIFNFFAFEPQNDGRIRASYTPSEHMTFSAEATGRYRYGQPGARELIPGGALAGKFQGVDGTLQVKASTLVGQTESRESLDMTYTRRLGNHATFESRLSLWNVHDPLRATTWGQRTLFSVSSVVGASYQFSPNTVGTLAFEADHNQALGTRYRVVGLFTVRVWS
jgi:hypothetical protein